MLQTASVHLVRVDSQAQVAHLANIAHQAWLDDPLFSWLCPDRRAKIDQFKKLWNIILNGEYTEKGKIIFLLQSEIDDQRTETMGFAIWERHGHSDIAKSWQGDSRQKFVSRLKQSVERLWLIINSSSFNIVSLKALSELSKEMHRVSQSYPRDYWRLSFLGVAPKYQKQGVGRRLIQWGLERADEERVATVLEASNAGKHLYESVGFVETGFMLYNGGVDQQSVMQRKPSTLGACLAP